MFTRLPEASHETIEVAIDGVAFQARAGDSVAAALLAAGHLASRTMPGSGASRGPFCLMGVCFDCLVTIDGVPNQQACNVAVASGMRIDTQRGMASLGEEKP